MTIFNPRTAYLRPRKFLHTIRGDAAQSLPAIASLASGEWWDSTSGLTGASWTGRTASGLILPSSGSPTVPTNVLNGRPVARFNQAWNGAGADQFYAGAVTPLGTDPTAFTTIALFRQTVTHDFQYVASVSAPGGNASNFYAALGMDESNGDHYFYGDYSRAWPAAGFYGSSTETDEAEVVLGSWCLAETPFDVATGILTSHINGLAVPADNGTPPANANPPIANFGLVSLGIFGGSEAATAFVGDIALFATVPVAPLSVSDRQKLYTWITAVFGHALPVAA